MLQRDQGHSCVLFWSLGNESQWGTNFAAEHGYARQHDPARPVIFSYPDSVPLKTDAYDIYSKHYPRWDASLESDLFPLLNDEFGHISCYNVETQKRDPGLRNFWGHSIQRFGDKFLHADGCLGGSIWAGIEEVFLMPEGPVGYGPWGVIDGWRRPKPEYWLTKKAYSPIRIEDRPLLKPEPGNPLTIAISNAFDHTNLREIEIAWSVGSDSGRLHDVDIPPHGSGYLRIPARASREGEFVDLRFSGAGQPTIDEFHLRIGPTARRVETSPPAVANLHQTDTEFVVRGVNLVVSVSRITGLVNRATFDGHVLIEGGPFLDLGAGPLATDWLLRNCSAAVRDGAVVIQTSGNCKQTREGIGTIPIDFEIEIDGSGKIVTRYRSSGLPAGFTHLGITYLLPANVDRLSWNRRSLWSAYPRDHIGRTKGIAARTATHPPEKYRVQPQWPWSQDMEDFFLTGKDGPGFRATNDFRSIKENIWYAAGILNGSSYRVRAEADADLAVRLAVQPDDKVSMSLYNCRSYPDLDWGNYTGAPSLPAVTPQEVTLRLTDQQEE